MRNYKIRITIVFYCVPNNFVLGQIMLLGVIRNTVLYCIFVEEKIRPNLINNGRDMTDFFFIENYIIEVKP